MASDPPNEQASESEARHPEWDDGWAEWLLGKYALVGITRYEADGTTVRSKGQYHGIIVEVSRHREIKIACEGRWRGETMTLPPVLQSFKQAKPGRYELKSTGEIVDDPDVVATWRITAPSS